MSIAIGLERISSLNNIVCFGKEREVLMRKMFRCWKKVNSLVQSSSNLCNSFFDK